MHGHGSTSSERVAADVVPGVAQVVEADVVGCCFEGCVDVGGCDCFPKAAGGLSVVGEGCAGRALMRHDVVDSAGQGFDGAVLCLGAFHMYALAFDSIFLVVDAECSFGCCEQLWQRCCIWYEASSGVSKSDIHASERLGVLVGRGVGALSNSQQEVEGNVD